MSFLIQEPYPKVPATLLRCSRRFLRYRGAWKAARVERPRVQGAPTAVFVNGDGIGLDASEHVFCALRLIFADWKIATLDILGDPAPLRIRSCCAEE
jgi:hypothetical protein